MQPSIFEKEYKFCPTCTAKLERRQIEHRQYLACPKCSFIFWNNPKPTVSAVITNDKDQVLMIQRNREPLRGYWVLPGGFIDYEEKPEEAIVREIEEEVGCKTRVDRLLGVYQIDNDPRGMHIDIVYLAKIANERIMVNEESSDFNFFSLDQLPELIAYKHREAISDWAK